MLPCASGSVVTLQIEAIAERNANSSARTQYVTQASSRWRGRHRRSEKATVFVS
jgi:hypothetical protein